jgi:2,3-dihydroxybenzoate decarboxylase
MPGIADAAVIDVHAHVRLQATNGAAGRHGPEFGTDENGRPWYRVGNFKLIGVKHTGSPFTDPELRLAKMHEAHIDFQVLSPSPLTYFHHIETAEALAFCQRHNDAMAELVRTYPDKLGGLAALPMQDPELASSELTRCVNELGFKGALVNGFSQVRDPEVVSYYDTPDYWPFWETVERLGVPFYLHPRNPLKRDAGIYEGHAWLYGPRWAFGQEAAVHALRLIGSGLFDRFPALTIVLGHLGEGLPYAIWRVDNVNGWVENRQNYPARKQIADYLYSNFYLATSGFFRTQTLLAAMSEMGADRILFAVDWPFEDISAGAAWFDNASISETDRIKIGRTNAARLFGLALA